MASAPTLSVAIPLHRSRPWVDAIEANVARIPHASTEILISDRTCLDDAVDVLADRLSDDPRVRFVRSADGLSWIEHYNDLLHRASGDFFMWMPHDDDFPSDYLPALVGALTADERALLAFGCIEPILPDGSPHPTERFHCPASLLERPWSWEVALELALDWNLGIPFRGVMRRRAVLRWGLAVRPITGEVFADGYWVFALALHGPLVFVPSVSTCKRYYPTSTHAVWRSPSKFTRSMALGGLLWRHAPTFGAALRGSIVLAVDGAAKRLSRAMPSEVRRGLGPTVRSGRLRLRRWLLPTGDPETSGGPEPVP